MTHDSTSSVEPEPFGALVRRLREARGLRQIDLATSVPVHDSYVSRIESGQRQPDAADVARIEKALPRLSDAERAALDNAFKRSLLDRYGLVDNVVIEVDGVVAAVEDGAAVARQLRLSGHPHHAVTAANNLAVLARATARQARRDSARAVILAGLARVLAEEVKGYLDFVVADEIPGKVAPLISEQYSIARTLDDESIERLASVGNEGALYVAGAHRDANLLCRDLLEGLDGLDRPWAQEVARAAAINAGVLSDDDELRRATTSINRLISELDRDEMTAVFLLEGLARGQAKLLGAAAVETLETAWDHLEAGRARGNFSNLRFVQLVRTHLETLSTLKGAYPETLIRDAEKAVTLCEDAEYERHRRQLLNLLNDS